jgi:hypothetical protein
LDSFASHGFIPHFQHQSCLAVMRLRHALVSNLVLVRFARRKARSVRARFNFTAGIHKPSKNTLTKTPLLQPMGCDFQWWQMVAANCIYSF